MADRLLPGHAGTLREQACATCDGARIVSQFDEHGTIASFPCSDCACRAATSAPDHRDAELVRLREENARLLAQRDAAEADANALRQAGYRVGDMLGADSQPGETHAETVRRVVGERDDLRARCAALEARNARLEAAATAARELLPALSDASPPGLLGLRASALDEALDALAALDAKGGGGEQ